MIKKSETCIYCGEKMESITAKKRYCSSKCKLYYNREKNKVKRGAPFKNMPPYDKSSPKSVVNSKLEQIPVENHKTPPKGLKGIDLVIWKSENCK
jgi:predicted nucleic acid-binding Zn ribbon protein